MELRCFGSARRKVAVIGQGTWYIESGDPAEVVAALRTGISFGVTHIDTAELYGAGVDEQIVGAASAGLRDEVFLGVSARCGRPEPPSPLPPWLPFARGLGRRRDPGALAGDSLIQRLSGESGTLKHTTYEDLPVDGVFDVDFTTLEGASNEDEIVSSSANGDAGMSRKPRIANDDVHRCVPVFLRRLPVEIGHYTSA
jgi:hypothetical protein